MNSNTSTHTAPIATQRAFSRPAALIGGGIGLVALTAVATTLALRSPAPSAADSRQATSPTVLVAQAGAASTSATAEIIEKPATPVPRATPAPKPVHLQRGTVKATAASPQRAASVCANCGRVESVSTVQQKGQGTGLGVVGGAVVGGLLGNQVGGGSGKSVATVLGAVGGGVAGNEVEKHARATTVFQVRVRMDDGSLRTVTQSTAPTLGQKVTVEGSTLRARGSTS